MTDVSIARDDDGLVTGFTDGMGTTSIEYYPSTWVRRVTDGFSKAVTYQYNGVGDLSTVTVPYGYDYTYTYDANNRLASVTNEIYPITFTFEYDGGGRLTRMDRPGGYVDHTYNARNWLTSVTHRDSAGSRLYRAYYSYSHMGTRDEHTGSPLRIHEYFDDSGYYLRTQLAYDHVHRLKGYARYWFDPTLNPDYSAQYGYDEVGNRVSETWDGTTTTYTYDGNDRLMSAAGGGLSASFGYDGSGNMTSVSGSIFGSWALGFDDESRLTSVTYPGGTDTYEYNALGQRMRWIRNGYTTRYVYCGERVLEENSYAGTVLAWHTPSSGSYYTPWLHMQRSGTGHSYPLYNGVGTVRGLVDGDGVRTDSYSMDVFGVDLGSTGSTRAPYKFGGAWGYMTDPSGMLQLGATHSTSLRAGGKTPEAARATEATGYATETSQRTGWEPVPPGTAHGRSNANKDGGGKAGSFALLRMTAGRDAGSRPGLPRQRVSE